MKHEPEDSLVTAEDDHNAFKALMADNTHAERTPHPFIGVTGVIGGNCVHCNYPVTAPWHYTEPDPLPAGELRVQHVGERDSTGRIVHVEITIDNPPTREAEHILMYVLPKVLGLFLQRNKDYGDSDDTRSLGAKAEFVRIWNKVGKLRRGLWDGEQLDGEQTDEIMMDLIGHLLLALARTGE